MDSEIAEYHRGMILKRNEITSKLNTIMSNEEIPAVYRKWISQTIKFIMEDCDVKL